MTKPASDTAFTSDVARFYESTLVPLIFLPYADDLSARTADLEPASVLEVACGTGVVTRALARTLPEACSILATDLNAAMVGHGESMGTHRSVTWRQADVMSLPCADGIFDVVVCQFAVMFFPDRVAAYKEVRRVLKPSGTFLFSLWNEVQRNDFADIVTEAVAAVYPDDPPAFLPRTPHGHGSPIEIEREVAAAGFERCSLTQRDEISTAPDPDVVAIAYCHGTPLRNEILDRNPEDLDRVTRVAAAALRDRFGDGPIEGRLSAVVVAAS